jgi:hypothetical protein
VCDQPPKSELILAYASHPVLAPLPGHIKGLVWIGVTLTVLTNGAMILSRPIHVGELPTISFWNVLSLPLAACGLIVCVRAWWLLPRNKYQNGGKYKALAAGFALINAVFLAGNVIMWFT